MTKPSALTAALNGALNGATVVPTLPSPKPPLPRPSIKALADDYAFPCLAFATEDGQPRTGVEAGEEGAEPSRITIVGSAPTSTSAGDTTLVDFPLSPYRRRSGKEAMPGASLRSSTEQPGFRSRSNSNYLSEAVIGWLPQGECLTDEERQGRRQSLTQIPSLHTQDELSQELLSARTKEGRKLRRSVLKGSVVVFVTAGYSGKRFIFQKAKELGIRSVVLDGPDSWVKLLEAEGVIERFVPIDFSEAETVFERCLAAVQQVSYSLGSIDGVTTFCEMAVPIVARLAEKLGLPGNSPAAVDAARDKFKTREALQAAGLPTPRHFLITSPADIDAAAAHVGFPAVIKPICGAASIGVIRVDDMEALRTAYSRVHRDLRRAKVVAGALQQGDDDDGDDEGQQEVDNADNGNAGSWINLNIMMEEYLDGPEVDCDLVLDGGQCVYGAITDNWPTVEPYFNETGSNCPSVLPRAQQQELLQLAVSSTLALGFKLGVFHVEGKYTSRGARLIEVNCRMGGGPVRDTNLLVWGVDLVEEHLMAACGVPVRPMVARRPLRQLAEYSINAKVSGLLAHTDFLAPWAAHPDMLYARPLVAPGERCVCVADGLPTWVCELMAVKPTVHEAIEFIKRVEAQTELPIVPAPAGGRKQ